MSPNRSHGWGTVGWLILSFALVVSVYTWVGPGAGGAVTTTSGELYYPALSDAFLSGQLHLKFAPDPRLEQLEKPWLTLRDDIPRIPEASYHHGNYYLYFSPLPALLLFMPVRLLFDVYPTDDFAILIFALAAWLVATGVLVWAWRRWFAQLSHGWLVMGILLLAFGTRAIFLLQLHLPHGVPIACAYFCGMMALAGVAWTSVQVKPLLRVFGLAFVSLAWGGAVACRPNLVFSLPAVGVLWSTLMLRARREPPASGSRFWRLAAAAVLPAAAVGLAMVGYNYARFGALSEFGVRFHVGSIDQEGLKFFGWENLQLNWRLFMLSFPPAPRFSTYFPFFPGWVDYWGLLWAVPILGWSVALPVVLGWPPRRKDGAWTTLTLTLVAAALLNGLSIMLLTLLIGVVERYVVDFLPFALLLSILTAFGVLERGRRSRFIWWRRLLGFSVWGLGGAALVYAGIAILVRSHPVARLPQLARAADAVVGQVERWRGVQHGPMTLRLKFHDFAVGTREPLLVSGNGRDIVYVDYVATDRIRFGLDHLGSVNLATEPLAIEVGKTYALELDLGCLYPSAVHPFFDGVPARVASALRQRLSIRFEGEPVLQLGCRYYPTQAGDLFVGRMGPTGSTRFTGTIVAVERPGLPDVGALGGPGLSNPVRLSVTIPPFRDRHREPLLSTGEWGRGDVVYVSFVGPNEVKFGHDALGGGAVESELVTYESDTPLTVDVALPSLDADHGASGMARLLIRVAGRVVLDESVLVHPSRPEEIFLGFNGANASAVGELFQGRIRRAESLDRPILWSGTGIAPGEGAVRLNLRFPKSAQGRGEPLLVAGEAGAADAIYVQYMDAEHIRIGHDHWGTAGELSAPIAIDYDALHVLEVSFGPRYPPSDDDAAWGGVGEAERRAKASRVRVVLNGRTVMDEPATFYSAPVGEIAVGRNAIGLSSCEPAFSGEIVSVESLGRPSTP